MTERSHDTASGLVTADPARRQQRQAQLPLRQALRFAWRNIRVRLGRSMLVIGGIALALAFLTNILVSSAIDRAVVARGSPELVEHLIRQGRLVAAEDRDQQVQTWWLAGLALLVSLVGILNAMLLSVMERFAEIGTMKCLGALDGLILKLFMLESAFQGLVGAVVGIMVGLAIPILSGLASVGAEFPSLLPGWELLRLAGLCLLAGIGMTILGALYPAWRAARMQPVQAMRMDA